MKLISLRFFFLLSYSSFQFYAASNTESCYGSNLNSNDGKVIDCKCRFDTVNQAITEFFAPLLANLTSLPFYRYFRVDHGRPCPFWREDGQCASEGCSLCTCEQDEVPRAWLVDITTHTKSNGDGGEYGWIGSSSSSYGFEATGKANDGHSDALGRLDFSPTQSGSVPSTVSGSGGNGGQYVYGDGFLEMLEKDHTDDDHDSWIDMSETEDFPRRRGQSGQFINLQQNPEGFTGYSGASARRVWMSIGQENCFGGDEDACLEKRVFFRLMSGLQASISTQIARRYFSPEAGWHANYAMFERAVGQHPLRMHNLYFTFLFLLRAASRAGPPLLLRPLEGLLPDTDTPNRPGLPQEGTDREDAEWIRAVRLVEALVTKSVPMSTVSSSATSPAPSNVTGLSPSTAASQQCREAFDESTLFQVSGGSEGTGAGGGAGSGLHRQYWQAVYEKQQLREDFRNKFRNISRILDCVTCEKCRMWSKLEVLGLGTAIRILLTPEEDLAAVRSRSGSCDKLWAPSRQEAIALINTLNQFATSIAFAIEAEEQRHLTEELDNHGVGLGLNTTEYDGSRLR